MLLTVGLAVLAAATCVHGSIFSVGHGGSVSRNGRIKFDNVLTDSDNSWNYFRSRFECSDEGYYYISFHGLARKNSALTLALYQNSFELVRAYGDGNGYSTASNSAIVFLNHGDNISLRVAEGRLHESDRPERNFATLSGYKIGGIDQGPSLFGSPASGAPGGGSAGSFSGAPGSAPGGAPGSAPGGAPGSASGGAPGGAAPDSEGGEDEFVPIETDNVGPSK